MARRLLLSILSTALVSAAPAAALPRVRVSGLRPSEEGTGGAAVAGTVTNSSAIAQRKLVVFATARRGGRVVAAGRAVVPKLAAHASAPFQAFLIGDARAAKLAASVPATTFD